MVHVLVVEEYRWRWSDGCGDADRDVDSNDFLLLSVLKGYLLASGELSSELE